MSSEALVVVVDVGPSLVGSAGHARAVQALEAARLVLRAKLQAPRARDVLGVVLCGTHETRHALAGATAAHRGVFVAYDLGPPCAAVLRFLAPRWALAGALAGLPLSPDADAQRLQLAACGAAHGDLVAALAVALDMLARRAGARRTPLQRVFVVSDLCSAATAAAARTPAADDLLTQLHASAVRLNVIDVGANAAAGAGEAAEAKAKTEMDATTDAVRAANLALLARVTAVLGPAAAVVPLPAALDLLTARPARAVPQRTCYRCALEITPDLRIGVHAYIKCREQPFPVLKRLNNDTSNDGAPAAAAASAAADVDLDAPPASPDAGDEAAGEAAPAGVAPGKGDVVRAYRYGKTLVPFSAADEAALRVEGARGLTLLGFARAASVPRHHAMGGADLLVADPGDAAAQRALAALVRAMAQTASVAVCRLVAHRSAAPALVALVPRPRAAPAACGCWVLPLPFAEDLRYYQFAPLLPGDRRARPDAAPSPEQREAARNLVEAMSLVQPTTSSSSAAPGAADEEQQEEEEEVVEYLAPKRTPNPTLRRFYDVVDAKTLVPGGVRVTTPLGCGGLTVPEPVRKRARAALEAFGRAFPLEPVAPDSTDPKQFWRDKLLSANSGSSKSGGTGGPAVVAVPAAAGAGDAGNTVVVVCGSRGECDDCDNSKDNSSGNNSSGRVALDDLVAGRTGAVGSVQPARDFAAMLARRDADVVVPAMEQLRARIRQFVRDSIGGQYFAKALDALVALRRGCVAEDEPALFNDLLLELQQHCSSTPPDAALAALATLAAPAATEADERTRDGTRFWAMVAEARVVPISHAESVFSSVPPEVAAHFHAAPAAAAASQVPLPVAQAPRHDEEIDDLFNMAD